METIVDQQNQPSQAEQTSAKPSIYARVSLAVLHDLLGFTDKESTKYALSGVRIACDSRGTWLEATDGRILARYHVSDEPCQPHSVVIPHTLIKMYPNSAKSRKLNISINVSGEIILASVLSRTERGISVEGRFPATDGVVNEFRSLVKSRRNSPGYGSLGIYAPSVLQKVWTFAEYVNPDGGHISIESISPKDMALIRYDKIHNFIAIIMPLATKSNHRIGLDYPEWLMGQGGNS